MASLEKKLIEKHWQKNPKAILTKTKFGPKYKWFKYLIIGILFLKILFRANKGFIFVQTFQWIPFEFFFNFRFSSKKSQSQQKLAKKRSHILLFWSKNFTHFTNLKSLGIENDMPPQHSQKPFWLYKFSANIFLSGIRKIFVLYHFLTPKNCILEALWKQMSAYFLISPKENVCSRDVVRFYLVRSEMGRRRLKNFLDVARCLDLAKCFKAFHFNWYFWKFSCFFRILILLSVVLKCRNFQDNLDFKRKIAAKLLIRSLFFQCKRKWQKTTN